MVDWVANGENGASVRSKINTIPNDGTNFGVAGVLAAANGGTGLSALGSGVATFLGTPSSANLKSALTDETGGGSLVFATSPTLETPIIGVAAATSINKVAITTPATSATLTIADGSTLATSGANSITLTSTGATNVTLPTSGTLATLAGAESLTNKKLGSLTTNGLVTTSSSDGTLSVTVPAANVLTFLATPSSANFAAMITDETGTGPVVLQTSPTLVTPAIGVATATSLALGGATIGSDKLAIAGSATISSNLALSGTGTQVNDVNNHWRLKNSGTIIGLILANDALVEWTNTTDSNNTPTTGLGQLGAQNIRLGLIPSATPVAQIFTIGEASRSGTDSNIGGAAGTLQSGLGTGTGTLSTLSLQSPIAAASGTTAQTYATGLVIKAGAAVLTSYTVAGLPAAATAGAGATAFVTDASTTLILGLGGTVTGGGTNKVPVYSDGTNWIYG